MTFWWSLAHTRLRITIRSALNLAFAEWVTVFAGDEKLTTALLDRLAPHSVVITTKGKSYRMRKRRSAGS
jgi:DNA replication protein DnaC